MEKGEQLETARDIGKHLLEVQLRECLENPLDDRVTLPLARSLIEGITEFMDERGMSSEEVEMLKEELREYAFQIYEEYFLREEDETDEEFEREARTYFERRFNADFLS